MKGRVVAMGIISLIGMITLIFLISHLIGEVKTTYDANTNSWIASESYKFVGKVLIEGAIVGLTAFVSLVLGVVHLVGKKESEKGLNITIGVLAIILFGINWILCLITFIKLSGSGKATQV